MYYTCPMHPEVQRDMPGICPECGMNLVPTKKELHKSDKEFDKHAGHSTNVFKTKFWVSLLLTIPVIAYSEIFIKWTGIVPPQFLGSEYLPLVLSSIIFFYGGWIFIAGAWRELTSRLPGMMTLISVAISAAYLWSIYAIFTNEEPLFWELTTLITIMLLGHWMEMRAVSGAQGALKELSKLLPDTAEIIRDNKTEVVQLASLKIGDKVIVKPGGKIPADGKVFEGESDVNEAMITGESALVRKKINDFVIAGTINGDGILKLNVAVIGEKTFLAGVMRLVAEAQASKSKLQILSDKAALYLTVIAILGGIATLVAWLFTNAGLNFAVARSVAVLVIACPHALGLAVPLVASISTTKAAQNGFLVKKRLALEAARGIDIVLFDKTGTLTEGKFSVIESSSDEALALAAAVDFSSEHPIAKAIVEEAREKKLEVKEAINFKRIPGVGGEAEVDGQKIFVGHRGGADIVVEVNGRKIGSIKVADKIREESRDAINSLKNLGIRTAMITGDSEDVAKRVAGELGIDEYFARVLPGEKSKKVKLLQEKGMRVAMVGDGINDAPALTQADLGIAIGAGTNVAIESAGIILVKNDPRDIVKIIRLSKMTYTKMIQNLFWATGYNVVALPLAAGVLAFKGIILQPALAALFMSLSTVIVAINAILLRRKVL
ncbi:MAG: cadmium-translocating P-type ATPase [Candidatus Colwellbacteria bacterium]|nr:cadmium-translocating P-type ATPase [Candidatus Colwellbacteria bacterium]